MTARSWTLPDDLRAASLARRHAGDWAAGIGWADEEADDLVLIVSELVTNGIRHGRPPVSLVLDRAPGDAALVTVRDAGQESTPVVRPASQTAGGGRGLAMIDALSRQSGWRRTADGLEVWAVVTRAVDPS